jgi:predicted nucleotidyltransferase
MRIPNPKNLQMVRQVAKRLGPVRESVVFVGGAVVDLLITDPAAPPVRPTKDVDVIVEVASLFDYHKLGDVLRSLGFKEDSQSEGGPICRWDIDGIKVDTMPMRGQALGFSSEYYAVAVETAVPRQIAEGLTIRLISAPCFLATKLEAFKDRGNDDFMGSSDIEDVVAVLDGRPEIIDEIRDSPPEVKNVLVRTFAALLEEEGFLEALPGYLEVRGENPERISIFLERVWAIASMDL